MQITGRTKLIGLFADPIEQVRTPGVLNPMLAARGADLVVVPLHVAGANLAEAFAGLRRVQSFAGFLATVPHKTAIPALCEHVAASARQVGAANSVRRLADGTHLCASFDGVGFVRGLMAQGHGLAGKRVLLAGAGGAASAIAFALAEAGVAELAIANRTRDKAEALAAAVRAEFPAVLARAAPPDPSGFDLIVNGSSLGMRAEDPLPLEAEKLDASMLVAEVIMQPETTRLLEIAASRGARTHAGRHMLAGQLDSILAFLTSSDPA